MDGIITIHPRKTRKGVHLYVRCDGKLIITLGPFTDRLEALKEVNAALELLLEQAQPSRLQ